MVMDYLAMKFNLFKIETIGDAYVAASGLVSGCMTEGGPNRTIVAPWTSHHLLLLLL